MDSYFCKKSKIKKENACDLELLRSKRQTAADLANWTGTEAYILVNKKTGDLLITQNVLEIGRGYTLKEIVHPSASRYKTISR